MVVYIEFNNVRKFSIYLSFARSFFIVLHIDSRIKIGRRYQYRTNTD